MIKAGNGKLEVRGSRDVVLQEFMLIVSQVAKLKVFDDIDELMSATKFAASSDEEQREMLKDMLNSMIEWMKEETKK